MKSISRNLFAIFFALNSTANFTFAEKEISELLALSLDQLLNIEIITASKTAQKLLDAPAKAYLVTDKMIQNAGYTSLSELLEDIPEIEIQRRSPGTVANVISIRGISGNEKFIILQDGIRISPATGDFYTVGKNYSLSNAKQIEIILGPASALYGADAFSGIINIITKKPNIHIDGSISGSYGEFRTTEDSFTFRSKLHDNISLSMAGQIYHSDEADFPSLYEEHYQWYNRHYKTSGKMKVSPFLPPEMTTDLPIKPFEISTDAHSLSLKLEVNNLELGYFSNFESHSSALSGRPEFNAFWEETKFKTRNRSVYGKHRYNGTNNRWGLKTTLSASRYEVDPSTRFVNTYSGYEEAFKYAFSRISTIDEQFFYDFSEDYSVVVGGIVDGISALPLTADLPSKYDKNSPADLQKLHYLGANSDDPNKQNLRIRQDFFNVEYFNFATYAQLQGKITDQLEFTFGGRYDRNSRYGETFSPRFAVVLTPAEKFKLKFLYGQSTLSPSPSKTYQHFGSFDEVKTELASGFFHLPNPHLKPEHLEGYEAVLSYFITDQIILSINAYRNQIEDRIVYRSTTDSEQQPFRGVKINEIERPVNQGRTITKGGTARLNGLHNFGNFNLRSDISYSFSDGEMDSGRQLSSPNAKREIQPLPLSAKHSIKGNITLSHKNFSLSTRLIHRSETLSEVLENNEKAYSEPFTLINLFGRYNLEFNHFRTSLFVKVNNLTNIKYYNVSSGAGGPAAFPVTPQSPRQILFGTEINF